jgi:hypothetical protein
VFAPQPQPSSSHPSRSSEQEECRPNALLSTAANRRSQDLNTSRSAW